MGWFTKKTRAAGSESNERYSGKPLLMVLDSYVLSIIGELSSERETEMLATLQRLYGSRDPNWRAFLRTRFQIPDSMDQTLRQMWVNEQERTEQEGTTLVAADFARMIVDQNFSHLIEEK